MFWNKNKKSPVFNFSCVYNCIKEKCPLWITLTRTYTITDPNTKEIKKENKEEGACSHRWIALLLLEIRQEFTHGNIN